MMKQLISVLLILCLAATMMISGAMAEEVNADPFEEIKAEFAHATKVDPYKVSVHPSRVSGWAVMRWAPSKSAPVMATYPAKQELTVLKETSSWLLVENEQTGDIGYIARADVTTELPAASSVQELKTATESDGKTTLGVIDINGAFSLRCGLPEGYAIKPVQSSSDQLVAVMTSEKPDTPEMVLSVAYDPAYASVERMNDLDEEALAVLEKTFTDTDPTVEITYGDTGLGTRLMVVRQSEEGNDYLDFLSIYKGYFVEFVMVAAQDAETKTLTDEQLQLCVDFLTDLDFVPVETASNDTSMLADGVYISNLSNYDPEAGTVHLEVMHTVLLNPAEAEALKVGDTLTVGKFSEKIEKLEKTEDGDIIINDSILLQDYGGDVHVYLDTDEYIETYVELTLPLPRDIIFYDWTDLESGEVTDEVTEHTMDEMIAMMTEDPAGFASNNVWVAFGIDGKIISVERYTSVQ